MSGEAGRAIAAQFDRIAPAYEHNRLAGWYRAQAAEVLSMLDPQTEGVVLDVGCGTGWFLRELRRRCPQARGVGIDISGAMVGRARELASPDDGLAFVQADWEALDADTRALLEESPVRAVVCTSTFHYFADPEAATRAFFRCVDPGGRLLLLDRARDGSLLTRLWDVLHRWLIRDRVRFHETAQIVHMLRNAGFEQVHVASRMSRLMWKGKLYTHLALVSAVKPPVQAADAEHSGGPAAK